MTGQVEEGSDLSSHYHEEYLVKDCTTVHYILLSCQPLMADAVQTQRSHPPHFLPKGW